MKKTYLAFSMLCGTIVSAQSMAANECMNLTPPDGIADIKPMAGGVSFKYSFVEAFKIKDRSVARRNLRAAEAKAKRAFVEWMKNDVAVSSQLDEAFASSDSYDDAGSKSAAMEIKTQLDSIAQKGAQSLTGVTVIANCMDMDNGEVGVTIAWSPKLSNLATSASVGQTHSTSNQSPSGSGDSSSGGSAVAADASGTNSASEQKVGLNYVTVRVTGESATEDGAIRVGLKRAISQVFGEEFASSSQYKEASVEIEAVGVVNAAQSLSVESQSHEMSEKTKGVIHKFTVVSKQEIGGGYKVELDVVLPEFKSSADGKLKVVVTGPIYGSSSSIEDMKLISDTIKSEVISFIGESSGYAVLDRDFQDYSQSELSEINSENARTSELARKGQKLGADLIIITEITEITREDKKLKLGGKEVIRPNFKATLNVRVLEPSTGSIVMSKKIPIKERYKNPDGASSEFAGDAAKRIARIVISSTGGKPSVTGSAVSKQNIDVDAASNRANDRYKKLKEEISNDW